jgi:acetyl-CoA carboxylase biotin carboxyl carrier protein
MPAPKGSDAKDNSAEDNAIDTKLVRKLADILNATGLTEIEVEQGSLRIKVGKQASGFYAAAPQAPAYAPLPAAPVAAPAAPAAAAAVTAAAPAQAAGEPVKSPMVGTCYLRPQPGADTFIKVGDKVSAGQTLLIVEAMKTMNPIPAPRAGTVAQIIAGDAEPVEFGEVLIILE